jgi:hypothetical protein
MKNEMVPLLHLHVLRKITGDLGNQITDTMDAPDFS